MHHQRRPRIIASPLWKPRSIWTGGHATIPTEAGTLELPRTAPPPGAQEEPLLPLAPARRLLECRALSDSTTSARGLRRAASPRWMSKDSVRVPGYHNASWDIYLTLPSSGIIHYPYPCPRRWRASTVSPSTKLANLEQESENHHDIRAQHRQSQTA